MDLVTGDAIWTRRNPISAQYQYLTGDIQCEVAIIGAGITGAICAHYFTEAGIDSIVVDKNIVGYGSTSASTSILQYEIDTDLTGLQSQIGTPRAVRAFKLCDRAVHEIGQVVSQLEEDCGFTFRNCFYYTAKDSDVKALQDEFNLRKQHGFDVEYVDTAAAEGRFSFPAKAGIYSRGSSAEIDPYRFAQALLKKAAKKGLRIYENTEVTQIKPMPDKALLTTQNEFTITAKMVIIATGYEAKELLQEQIVTLTRSFTVVSKPLTVFDGWYERCIIRDTEEMYTYIRSTEDNRLIIGGEDIPVDGEGSPIARLSHEDPVSQDKYRILEDRARTMFPQISDLEFEFRFSGLFGDTKDSLPRISGHQNYPNCYFCLGYGANGIPYAVLGGWLLRDLYMGNPSSDLDMFKINR